MAFIQAVAEQGIDLWNLREVGGGYEVCVLASDFRHLRGPAWETRTRVRILRRQGWPFRLRGPTSSALVYGLIIFIGVLYILGSFVWRIEISGLELMSAGELLEGLERAGLRVGVPKRLLDTTAVEDRLLLAMPRLSWVSVELRGTTARVTVLEKTTHDEILRDMLPADIVAGKDGRLVTLIALEGIPKAREGDWVEAGQVLIAGDPNAWEYFGRTQPTDPWPPPNLRARGIAEASVVYDLQIEMPYVLESKRRTGATWRRTVLRIGVRQAILTGTGDMPYEHHELERHTLTWRGGQGEILAELSSLTYYEVERTREDLGLSGARAEAEACLRRDFGQMIPPGAVIVSEQVTAEQLPHAVAVRLMVEVIEDIGQVRTRSSSAP